MLMKVDATKMKAWREDRLWSQEHLADLAGVSLRTVQRLENGESVSRDTVMALAAAYGVEPTALAVDARGEVQAALVRRDRQRKRDADIAFWIHLFTYVGVIGLLFFINLASDPEEIWVTWPAIGWGVGVFAHGAAVFLSNRFSTVEDDVETLGR